MKPVSYQAMPSSIADQYPYMGLERLLNTSNGIYCDKCGFRTTDPIVFKKHMMDHAGTSRFSCIVCNHVFASETQLKEHLKQHTTMYSLKCQHCGQVYMRRRCLEKHIERVHGKSSSQTLAKPGSTKNLFHSVPGVFIGASTADRLPLPPTVRGAISTSSAPAVKQGNVEPRGKTLNSSRSNGINGITQHASTINRLIQPNRALTVSLPEEVSIPAGCVVEFVEVKTVNGTKELKLRLISQQENESVIKDTRTASSQSRLQDKRLSSPQHLPNSARATSMSASTCIVNRKQYETYYVNLERPAVASVPNLAVKDTLKRTSSEWINLDDDVPQKVPKSMQNPVREGNSRTRLMKPAPVSHNSTPASVICNRTTGRANTTNPQRSSIHSGLGNGLSSRMVEERKKPTLEHSKSIPPRRASDHIQDLSATAAAAVAGAAKMERVPASPKGNMVLQPVGEVLVVDQKSTPAPTSLRTSVTTSETRVRASSVLLGREGVAKKSFPMSRTTGSRPVLKPPPIKQVNTNMSSWSQESNPKETVRRDVSEPKSFPVISSVFSLSEQPQQGQGSMQPLVMALRGMVMDKKQASSPASEEHVNKINATPQTRQSPVLEHPVSLAAIAAPPAREESHAEKLSDTVKKEEQEKFVKNASEEHVNEINAMQQTRKSPVMEHLVSVAAIAAPPASEASHAERLGDTVKKEVQEKFVKNVSEEHLNKINAMQQTRNSPVLEHPVTVAAIAAPPALEAPLAEKLSDTVKKEEQEKFVQDQPSVTPRDTPIKEEKPVTVIAESEGCNHAPALQPPEIMEPEPTCSVEVPGNAEPRPQSEPQRQPVKNGDLVTSKFLTISLKRIELGEQKKSKKEVKLSIPQLKAGVTTGDPDDCAVIYPMPLKQDQLVKRPGPNQPVVVLNHPKPRLAVQGREAKSVVDTPEPRPKCQILKMRLGKVMGQKYEVMGCTVGDFH